MARSQVSVTHCIATAKHPRIRMAAVLLSLLIVGAVITPAYALVTPIIIESRMTSVLPAVPAPNFACNGPAGTTAKSTAPPLANWTAVPFVGYGCWYAGQTTPSKWGEWAFTPAAGQGGCYNVYVTWANNAYQPTDNPTWTVHSADADIVVDTIPQTSANGNVWHLLASGVRYDEGVTKSVRLATNPPTPAESGRRTYYDAVAFEPGTPTAPTPSYPENGAVDHPVAGIGNDLGWIAGDNNYRFDLYLSDVQDDVINSAPGALAASDISTSSFDPDGLGLDSGTTYYWKIVAKNLGEVAEGAAVWSFTAGGFVVAADPVSWTNQNTVTITFDASAAMASLDHCEVSIDGGAYTTQTSPYVMDVSGVADGMHTVNVKAVDTDENEMISSVPIYLDKTDPVGFTPTAEPDVWTNMGHVTITFATTDATSGIDHYEVGVDGGSFSTCTSPYSLNVGALADGTHTVSVRAIDVAGNVTTKDVTISLDKTSPVAFTPTIDPVSWTNANSAEITFSTTDATSGVAVYVVAVDGGTPTPQTSPYTLNTSGLSSGVHTVQVFAIDAASNMMIGTVSSYIDRAAPVITQCEGPVATNSTPIPVDYALADPQSGVKKVDLWFKKGSTGDWTDTGMTSADASGQFLFAGTTDDDTYYFGLVVEDNVGNILSTNSEDGSCQTELDHTGPDFTSIDASPEYAKAGTAVTITFTASEELGANPDVDVNGAAATFVSVNGLDYTYTYTVQAGDAEGWADIHIEGADLAGNADFDDDLTQLFIDKTAPEDFAPTADPAAWTSANTINISFSTTDSLSGIDHYEVALDGGAYSTQTSVYAMDVSGVEGTRTVHVKAVDLAGNERVKDVAIYIDRNGPEDFTPTADPASWTGANSVTISFSTTDAGTGVDHYEVALDGGAYSTQTSPYVLDVSAVADGTHTVHVKAVDGLGNELVRDVSIYLDKAWPAGFAPTADPAGWTNANTVSISFSTTDATSGINRYEVAVDGGAYSAQTSPYALDVSGLADGSHTVDVKAIDNAGHERVNSVTIYTDRTTPVMFTPTADPNGWTNANTVTVTFGTTDATAGIARYEVALDGGAYSTQTSPYSMDVSAVADGTHTVHVKAIDNGGNEIIRDVSIYLDKTGPQAFTVTSDPATWYSWPGASNVQITWATSDAASGVDHYEVALDAGAYSAQTSPYSFSPVGFPNGTYTLHVKAIDLAGNETICDVVCEATDDVAPPTASLTFVDPNPALGRDFDYVFWKNWMGVTSTAQNTYNINWTAADTHTGVSEVYVDCRPNSEASWSLLASSTEATGTVAFDVSGRAESDSYEFRIRATDGNGNQTTAVYDQFGLYDATRLAPKAKIISPSDGARYRVGTTIKIKVQDSMPVFKDPRDPSKAYKDGDRDWWFVGHTLTATPQLRDYYRKSDGRPTRLKKVLLASIPRGVPQSVANTDQTQVSQFLSYVIVNTWETAYTLRKPTIDTKDVFQVELKYSDVTSVGNVRQPDKPNIPGQVLPTIKQEPLVNTLKQYEFSRFWVL